MSADEMAWSRIEAHGDEEVCEECDEDFEDCTCDDLEPDYAEMIADRDR